MVKQLTAALIFLALGNLQAQEPVRITVYDTFPPFSFYQEGKLQGIYPDVLKILFEEEMGLPLEITGYPWARAQLKVKEAEADGFVTVPTPERLEYVIAVNFPVAESAVAVYTSGANPLWEKVKTIGKMEEVFSYPLVSYLGNGWLKALLPPSASVVWVPQPEKMLPLLSTDRPFVALESEFMMDWMVKTSQLEGSIRKAARFNPVPQFLCIGKKSSFASLIPQMEQALRRISGDGRLKAVLDRYR